MHSGASSLRSSQVHRRIYSEQIFTWSFLFQYFLKNRVVSKYHYLLPGLNCQCLHESDENAFFSIASVRIWFCWADGRPWCSLIKNLWRHNVRVNVITSISTHMNVMRCRVLASNSNYMAPSDLVRVQENRVRSTSQRIAKFEAKEEEKNTTSSRHRRFSNKTKILMRQTTAAATNEPVVRHCSRNIRPNTACVHLSRSNMRNRNVRCEPITETGAALIVCGLFEANEMHW